MKTTFLISIIVAFLSAQASANKSKLRKAQMDMAETRIIGGQLAQATGKKFPWFVATGQCGASLVAPDVVMSAAHCYGTIKSSVLVGAVNEYNPSVGDAQTRNVIPGSLVKHPQYDPRITAYDFMLFKIQRVTKPHLTPIKLNTNDAVPSTGSQLTVIGTGALNPAGTKYDPNLRWVNINAVSHQSCSSRYGNYIKQNAMLCAMAQGKDSCYGDSGGPLLNAAGVQVGVVSWGADCADKYYPGVYSRVSGSISWLQRTICELSDAEDELDFCGSSYSGGTVLFSATIQYDRYAAQTGWYIKEAATGKMVVNMPKGKVRKGGAKMTKTIALQPGRRYLLVMLDKNGFSKGKTGYIRLVGKKGGNVVWTKTSLGKFRKLKKVAFTVPYL